MALQAKKHVTSASLFLAGLFLLFIQFGCETMNSHRGMGELSDHFASCGLKIDHIQPMEAGVVKATQAMIIVIDGKDIGVYKYDMSVPVQKQRVTRIASDGFIYVMGIKYPVLVKGSFVILGAQSHPQKHEIIKAFNSFK
jgi:hypothetical protein